MSTIVVTLLPVGQGAMNLIEIYERIPNRSSLLHLSLIDCGIDRTRSANYDTLPEHTKLSVDYVVAKMNERIKQSPRIYLDYVLFTHRDSDHWTLFDTILQRKFGTTNISDKDDTTRTLHRDINDTVSEDFFGILETSYFSYTRTYSQINGLDILEAKYQRTFQGDEILEESLDFYNTEQNYQVLMQINFQEQRTTCEVYDQDNCPVIKAQLKEHVLEKTSTLAEYVTFMREHPVENNRTLECPFIPESPALWTAWSLFVTYLSVNELSNYAYLDCINMVLKEGLNEGGFLYVSKQDIVNILSETEPITSIVGQFLWGGNPERDGTKKKKTGVGILREKSQFLAVNGAIEVSPYGTKCSHFQLCQNICLDILERIPIQAIQSKEVEGAESTKSSAIRNNGTSAVALLSVQGNDALKFLFTGDATIHTFHSMYRTTALLRAKGAVWTAPHHGSYTTSKGVFCINKDKPEEKKPYFPYLLFVSQPQAMVVESELGNKHGLPNISFFRWVKRQFQLNKPPLPCKPHFLYVNSNDNKNADWNMGYTPYPIYSGVSAEENPDNPPDPGDPNNLRNPVITYKIHRYSAEKTDTQYIHEEENIATDGIFRTVSQNRRRPGQPAPPPQESDEPSRKKPDYPSAHLFLHR